MTNASILERLAAHRLLSAAPATERKWLAERGTLRTLEPGDVITKAGEQADSIFVVLSGVAAIRIDRGAGAHKIFEWRAGDIGGILPFSRGASPPADAVVDEPTDVFLLPRHHLPALIRECPGMTAIMVHVMLDRARAFNANDLRDEKLVSLGRLAAGLAHELNNPASAAVRSARLLAEHVGAAEAAARAIGEHRLSEAEWKVIKSVRSDCDRPVDAASTSPMARADREDAISAWLAKHGASEACAAPLAETGVTIAALDGLAASVKTDALNVALRWIAAGCSVRALTSEIEMAASRIYDLVDSVKGFTFMDHAPTPEPVDIRRGINDTLTMLTSKVKAKGASVTVEFADDLPLAHAVGAELNQVWMNVIDNALDAIAPGGSVRVSAAAERERVVVRITDNGPGIPDAIKGRIFDPFFTTKGVGTGTGLGLDIVRRILRRHASNIDVESSPGKTEFRVELPTAARLAHSA